MAEAARPLKDQLQAEVAKLDIPGIIWTQFTPHWNDGDECVFDVHSPLLIVKEPELADIYDEERVVGIYKYIDEYIQPLLHANNISAETYEAVGKLAALIKSEALSDALKEAFGDHAIIKVTPTSFTVDEYEHD